MLVKDVYSCLAWLFQSFLYSFERVCCYEVMFFPGEVA